LKKTPKAVFEPMVPRKMRKAAAITRLPEKGDKEAPPMCCDVFWVKEAHTELPKPDSIEH